MSDVLETAMGFHIILLRSPPPREEVKGARIVVRYATTLGDTASARTRADALSLARTIVAQARSGADFTQLVAEHSEDPDRTRHGEMGVWVTTDPGVVPTTIEKLAHLQIGEVSNPIDTRFGFQLLKRMPFSRISEFGMRAIKVPYDPQASDSDPESVGKIHEQAVRIAFALKQNPQAFHDLQVQYGSVEGERWSEGHASPSLTSLLESLQFGEIASSPLRDGYAYVVPQRLDPEVLAWPAPPIFDLPRPSGVDVEAIIKSTPKEGLLPEVQKLRGLLGGLQLPEPERAALIRAIDQLHLDLARSATPDERIGAYRGALVLLYSGLSEAHYADVMTGIKQWLSERAFKETRL